MDNKEREELEKYRKQKERQYERQNRYARENYDRVGCTVSKGRKADIERAARARGYRSVSAYIVALIDRDISELDGDTAPAAPPTPPTGYYPVGDLPF